MEGDKRMTFQSMQLDNRNPIARHYIEGKLDYFFSYSPNFSTRARLEELDSRHFPRETLATHLRKMNQGWGASRLSLDQIERLRDPESVVVIGGQQAGILTGPLYTIHKIVSIVKYARMQEEKLNRPVIPVFWIAGEDHDYAEINHVYTTKASQLLKKTTTQQAWRKISISDLSLDKERTEAWLKELFTDLPETLHTKEVFLTIQESLTESTTFVDFFAILIHRLFQDSGIVLIDSGNEELRKIEAPYFLQMIERQESITEAINETAEQLQVQGYPLQVDVSATDANLFYRNNEKERVLLFRDGERWIGKHEEVVLTTDQLKSVAQAQPEKLSNNVMTRPLMQESLFPTLAFIAGDGEISYWALLKKAFTAFDPEITMPPVIPRLSITLVSNRIAKLLEQRHLEIETVIRKGCSFEKMNWLYAQHHPPVEKLFDQFEQSLRELHQPLQAVAKSLGPDLGNEASKNMDHLRKETNYLKRRILQRIEDQQGHHLGQFDEIEVALRPKEGLQERVLNIFPFINEYGMSLISDLLKLPLDFEQDHYLVYLYGN